MYKYITTAFLLIAFNTHAQTTLTEKQQIHSYIDTLTSPSMHGRGYVMNGRTLAANYIQGKFREFKLKPVPDENSMVQRYSFPVNTFPGKMELRIDGRLLKAGDDYVIDAASASFTGTNLPVEKIDMTLLTDGKLLKQTFASFDTRHIYILQNMDTFCKLIGARQEQFTPYLPKGCYIIPQKAKSIWTVEQKNMNATVFYAKQTALAPNMKTGSVSVRAQHIPEARNENIIAEVPGDVKDSFIVFSAHYDHLGMMGDSVYFPGASDNASGTAMLLYLASYFAAHPQHYSIVFISFSGEEAGLLGSAYYVEHPTIPLSRIKFLANIDIMGDATDGVTVVNATEYTKEFTLLNKINNTHKYIPIIKSRGKAANSDHYNFSEKGVHAFFLYSNGGKGFYHDIFDVSKEVTLNNVDGVAKLLIDFVKELR